MFIGSGGVIPARPEGYAFGLASRRRGQKHDISSTTVERTMEAQIGSRFGDCVEMIKKCNAGPSKRRPFNLANRRK